MNSGADISPKRRTYQKCHRLYKSQFLVRVYLTVNIKVLYTQLCVGISASV